ncbi:hypothetical protein LL038_21485 [Clostridium estertheticum]|uniref:Uncharacterized protein n=1 Tax=Clostridium estertheticum TaxID=238834 RepID=A0AA47EJC5_9CLOT|nr:hypothetical protein [Clostridium estertheticum]MBU3155520.1 hypothetical protein [Clostridium estertheticum]WAG60081.1 hypothetical protein LL038_21485 [Clostridium estertheticum]
MNNEILGINENPNHILSSFSGSDLKGEVQKQLKSHLKILVLPTLDSRKPARTAG